ncbi:regucalcin-like, partial [Anoplophora glabripennis]|uniref:regucalcin-like n=1 Tax=Anoplophora glabripennis TaxID=217634 RepID=UPI000C76F7A1
CFIFPIFFILGTHVSLIIPVEGRKNTFLISKERELLVVTWDGESDNITVVKKINTDNNEKFNDGKCDPTGRLWVGTLAPREGGATGCLYSIEKGHVTKVADKIIISNGLAFNTEIKKMYYIDTHTKTVDDFDFDVERGTIKNRHPIFTLPKHDIPGGPDGMTIDTDGNLWVATFGGGRIFKIDPRKPETLLYTISLPAKQITSVAFGGSKLDELYVTTACVQHGDGAKLSPPENGGLYRITGLGARGFPAKKFII